jgi:enoyl-[acyl-carrier-protein] reductase (NADH)
MTLPRSNFTGTRDIAHVPGEYLFLESDLSKHEEPHRVKRCSARELKAFGITVNAMTPGPIITDIFNRSDSEDQQPNEFAVVGRRGTPGDVAHATMFLLSSANSFMTGRVLHVCDGASLGSASW